MKKTNHDNDNDNGNDNKNDHDNRNDNRNDNDNDSLFSRKLEYRCSGKADLDISFI